MQSRGGGSSELPVRTESFDEYNPKSKDVKLTLCDKLIIAFGAATVVFILVLFVHPTMVEQRDAYRAEMPFGANMSAVDIHRHTKRARAAVVGYATPEATEVYAYRQKTSNSHFSNVHGLYLSSIGIGSYLGEPNEETATKLEEAVHDSVLGGINVIDTSINYLGQRAEKAIGRALRRLFVKEHALSREAIFISTKAGFIPSDSEKGASPPQVGQEWKRKWSEEHDGKLFPSNEIVGDKHCISPECIDASLLTSIHNLGVPTIDLLYLHNVEKQLGDHHLSRDQVLERIGRAFTRLEYYRSKGVIRFYGLATWNSFRVPEKADAFLDLGELTDLAKKAAVEIGINQDEHGFRFIQAPLSMSLRELAASEYHTERRTFLESAAAYNITIMSSRSIDMGSTAKVAQSEGVYSRCVKESTDHPSYPLSEIGHTLNAVRSVVTTALVGMKEEAHVKDNLRVLHANKLTKEESACIFTTVDRHPTAGQGQGQLLHSGLDYPRRHAQPCGPCAQEKDARG